MEYTGFILPNCQIPCKRCHKLKISFFHTYKSFLADLNVRSINFSLSLSLSLSRLSTAYFLLVLPLLFSNGKFEKTLN